MTRPRKERKVKLPPLFQSFKPTGLRKLELGEIILTLAEFEAIRLADYEGLEHQEASEYMEISRSTFSRLVEKARGKVATMLTEGKVLNIEGGNIHFNENLVKCKDCGAIFRIKITDRIRSCRNCGSNNLINLAESFGHGRCCRRKGR